MLLGLDPMARPLLQWEAAHPIPPPTLEEADQDPAHRPDAKELDGLMKLNPPLRAMHPFGATLAQECVSLFMYDVRTLALETQAHVPVLRPLAGAGRHDLGLRPAPAGPPDTAVAPAHRALDPQDTQSPVAPRGPAGHLSRRQDHLDPPRPGTGGHLAGQSGQCRSTPADQSGAIPAPPPRSGSASARSRCDRLWPSTRRLATAGASTSTTTP